MRALRRHALKIHSIVRKWPTSALRGRNRLSRNIEDLRLESCGQLITANRKHTAPVIKTRKENELGCEVRIQGHDSKL